MVGIFKDRNTFQVLFLFIIAVLAKLAYILHPPALSYLPHQGLLADSINNWYSNTSGKGLFAVLALLINLGTAVYFNMVLMSQRMFSKVNLLVAMSVILMSSLMPDANILSAPLLLLPLLVWLYQNLSALYHSPSPKSRLFNAGIGIGIGAILYHPFITFIVVAFFALATMRTFKIQEWLILILGLITPYYFFFAYEFLRGTWHPLQHVPRLLLDYKHLSHDPYSLLADGMILFWVAVGLFHWQSNLRRMLIQARKNWNIMLVLAAWSVLMLFMKTGPEADAFTLAVIPLSSFAASAFAYPKKNFIPALLFWIIIFMVILTCLQHYDGKI